MEKLTLQDWYRVRRGEDEIVWGLCEDFKEVRGVSFSRRAGQEFAFLDADQKRLVADCMRQITQAPYGAPSSLVHRGFGRWVARAEMLRIVYRLDDDTNRIFVSTIRGGAVLDPEFEGPPPSE